LRRDAFLSWQTQRQIALDSGVFEIVLDILFACENDAATLDDNGLVVNTHHDVITIGDRAETGDATSDNAIQ